MNVGIMKLRTWMAAGLLAAFVPAAALASNHRLWTSPDPVVAGEPARLLYSNSDYGGERGVDVSVEGNEIRISHTGACALPDPCTLAPVATTSEVELPPLDEGTYTVVLEWETGHYPAVDPVEAGAITVHATGTPRVLPADGFWSVVGEPGSGLYLAERNGLLTVSLYSYRPDVTGSHEAFWQIGTAPYAGDTALVKLTYHEGGECLTCDASFGNQTQRAFDSRDAVRLRFESSRRAWLDSTEGAEGIALVSLPYGADYVTHQLKDSMDSAFEPLALPDLRGRWIFAIEGADADGGYISVALNRWEEVDGEVRFDGNIIVACRDATDDRSAGCRFLPLVALDPPLDGPRGTFFEDGWFAALGDIQEDRIRGSFEADGRTWQVQGFRTAAP